MRTEGQGYLGKLGSFTMFLLLACGEKCVFLRFRSVLQFSLWLICKVRVQDYCQKKCGLIYGKY